MSKSFMTILLFERIDCPDCLKWEECLERPKGVLYVNQIFVIYGDKYRTLTGTYIFTLTVTFIII